MQISLIGILIFSTFFAGVTYYLGYYRSKEPFYWLSQSSFIITIFLLIPLLLIVLWLQNDSQNKLAEIGFVPVSSIQQSVGISVGIGENPTWIFETNQGKEAVFSFYRNKNNRQNWELVSDTPAILLFKQENRKMVIALSEVRTTNTLIFSLNNNSN